MLHFYRFSSVIEPPVPARDTYVKRPAGKGWPEECPPLRAANAFGWDVLSSFDMTFRRRPDGSWKLENEVEVESDWLFHPGGDEGVEGDEAGGGAPLSQINAWFWDKDQMLPHVIDPGVYPQLRNQVKVSTFLYLATDPNELLFMTDIPNLSRPFRALTVLVDTDWYPASYPWHTVLELNPQENEVVIGKGTPLCRLFTVRRDSYFAREMSLAEFELFFARGQEWLKRHGKGEPGGNMDITRTYVRQQQKSRFSVIV